MRATVKVMLPWLLLSEVQLLVAEPQVELRSKCVQTGGLFSMVSVIFYRGVEFNGVELSEAIATLAKLPVSPSGAPREFLNLLVLPGVNVTQRVSGTWDRIEITDLFQEIVRQAGAKVYFDPYLIVIAPKALSRSAPLPASAPRGMIIPRIGFRAATLEEGVAYLNRKAQELGKPGDHFRVEISADLVGQTTPPITFDLWYLPLSECVRYIAEYAGLEVEWSSNRALLKRPSQSAIIRK